jgi:polyisoprenoid-binding protein YceI
MEADKYPFATFTGKMEPLVDFNKPGTYQVKAKGKLNIHGVEVEREFTGTLVVNADKTAELKSTMEVPLADHKIEKPQLVMMKIADKIAVTVDFILKPKAN